MTLLSARYWYVVADSARARIFTSIGPQGELEEVDIWLHPESRLKDQHLVSDAPGRSFDSYGKGRHAVAPGTEPGEQEALRFATEIGKRLDKARKDSRFDQLVLVAAPRFLGLMREALKRPTRDCITHEVAKNFVTLDPPAIRERMP